VAQKLISASPLLVVEESAAFDWKGERILVTSVNGKLVRYRV